jgi:hypothetical protein
MSDCDYFKIVADCEAVLEKYGDTFQGVGWTKKKEYADLRYRIMLEGIRPDFPRPVSLLDFGCGASHLYEYLVAKGIADIDYAGLDLSEKYLSLCRRKFPHLVYHQADILAQNTTVPLYDYVVMNGILTYKGDSSHDAMWRYCQELLLRIAKISRQGFAFNIMSKYVDWKRDDLFYMPFDIVAQFLNKQISRHFSIRHDYGLFEYSVHVYKTPLSDLC